MTCQRRFLLSTIRIVDLLHPPYILQTQLAQMWFTNAFTVTNVLVPSLTVSSREMRHNFSDCSVPLLPCFLPIIPEKGQLVLVQTHGKKRVSQKPQV